MLQKRRMKEESEAANRGDINFLRQRMETVGGGFFRSQDSDGKNILHILFNMRLDICFIEDVFKRDPKLVCQKDNLNGDTPIHVLARRSKEDLLSMCHQFIMQQERITDVYDRIYTMQNEDGNTPLHAALMPSDGGYSLDVSIAPATMMNRREETAVKLLEFHNKLVSRLKVLHGWNGKKWTDDDIPLKYKYIFFSFLFVGNIKGNTVLHLAIQNKRFNFIKKMFDIYKDDPGFPVLLETVNKDDETPAYLIGEMETIPPDVKHKILRHPVLWGIRSTWGIPKKQFQNYISSMNVIAALLTTITFTAAFTVPGGLNQETGTPILIEAKAFRAFMAFDVIAMCLSMMVLFCMLWIVATKKRESVMIQDFAVALLLASFIATIITFISGVYATIQPVNPHMAERIWIGCCLLMVSVEKHVLVKLLLPLIILFSYPIRIICSTIWTHIYHLYECIKSFWMCVRQD